MKPPCRVCDRQTATHRATNPRATNSRDRTWLVCGTCIRRSPHGPQYEYELLPQEVA